MTDTSEVLRLLDEVADEEAWLGRLLHITANEPLMSDTARRWAGTRLADRYYMGPGDADGVVDFQPFTFLGWPATGELVAAAERAACRMLKAHTVTFAPLSGLHAMTCALLTATDPGDVVMTLHLDHGGHFATERLLERIGRGHVTTSYDVRRLTFDTHRLADEFATSQATVLYLDASFYLGPHDLQALRAAVGDSATIIYDASHTLGLIMGGRFQAPLLEGADVICGNTHKTLPGPQKGLIAFRDGERAEKALGVVQGGLVSSPHAAAMLGLAVTILEMEVHGPAYADQVVANANALGEALEAHGHEVRRLRGDCVTKNHQVHLMTDTLGDYRDLYARLRKNGIIVNFDRALGGRAFVRLGTQELTRRGMVQREMVRIAGLIAGALEGLDVARDVAELVASHQTVHFSFDGLSHPDLEIVDAARSLVG